MARRARSSAECYGASVIDADVQTVIKAVLDAGLSAVGITAIVARAYNPTTQGAPLEPVVVFTKIASRRFGYQGQKYVLISPGAPITFDKTEVYYSRSTYQLSGFMTQEVLGAASLNAFDVLDTCATILQSQEGRAIFAAVDIGVDRVTDIRTPHSLGDSDRFQMDVSFDFVLSYKNQLTSIIPGALVSEGIVERV